MKGTYSIKYNSGFGLLEVLVTAILAVGLLSVAALQGDLMGGSRTNKTRAECKVLANTIIEQMRDRVEKSGATGYASLASSTTDQSIPGITETFSRSWNATALTSPERKEITVTVAWGTVSDLENQCVVQSVIAYTNPGNSLLAADASAGAELISGPSPNAESSDDIAEYIKLPTPATEDTLVTIDGQTYLTLNQILLSDGATVQKGVLANLCSSYSPAPILFEQPVTFAFDTAFTFSQKLKTRRINYDDVSGKEAIELFEVKVFGSQDYCIPRVRYNGGVIIPISGMIYSKVNTAKGITSIELLSVDLFTFNASESGTYCIFEPLTGETEAPYICYVGGNCKHGPAGILQPDGVTAANSGDETIVTQCPNPTIAADKVGPGGWRGKVGLLGIAANNLNVCLAEEVAGLPVTLDTARNYFSRRVESESGVETNEGINKSYKCHDFWIIKVPSPTKTKVHDECLAWATTVDSDPERNHSGDTLASKTIQRDISGNNVFDTMTGDSSCSTSY